MPERALEPYIAIQPEVSEPRNGKRPFDAVFAGAASAIDSQRLTDGQRVNHEVDQDDEEPYEPPVLVYTRASGEKMYKPRPEYLD